MAAILVLSILINHSYFQLIALKPGIYRVTALAEGYLSTCTVFLKMLPKFKMATRGQLQKNLWAQKLKSEIIQILLSHSPPYGDVQVTFSRFTEIQNGCHGSTSIFLEPKNSKY